jgi:hypothetical protein
MIRKTFIDDQPCKTCETYERYLSGKCVKCTTNRTIWRPIDIPTAMLGVNYKTEKTEHPTYPLGKLFTKKTNKHM